MEHKFIQGGHEWLLDNGATVRAVDVARSRSGRIYGNLKVLANADTPEETILGGGVVDLSDAQARYRLAVALSKQNGAAPDPWADTLLAVWYALDEGLNAQNETFSPVDLAEFDEPLPPKYTVEQLLPSGKPSEGYGDNGAGKSTSFDYLGLCVVTGKPFLGYNVIRGPVLKLDFELDREITLWRCYQLARGMGLKRVPKDFYYQNLASPLSEHLDAFTQWCVNLSPALVEIDSLGPAMAEDPLAHKLVIQFMNKLRATGRSILVIDHQSKPQEGQSYQGKRSMGSGYKGHLVRSSLQIEMATSAPGKASLILRQHKNSFGPKADPIPYHIIFEKQAIRLEKGMWDEPEFLESSMMTSEQKIERYLREHDFGTKAEILEATGLNDKTFDNAISKLRKRGVVPREAGRDGLNRVYNLV